MYIQKTRYIICCGMIRSASTLQYQIVKELVERAKVGKGIGYLTKKQISDFIAINAETDKVFVIKTHEFFPEANDLDKQNKTKFIYSYRDIRDVIVSYLNKYRIKFDELPKAFNSKIYLEHLKWMTICNIYTAKYEDFAFNLKVEVANINDFLDMGVDTQVINDIAAKLSIEQQKEFISTVNFETEGRKLGKNIYERETLLHNNHIFSGEIGQWKKSLTNKQIGQIQQNIKDYLQKNLYTVHPTIYNHKVLYQLSEMKGKLKRKILRILLSSKRFTKGYPSYSQCGEDMIIRVLCKHLKLSKPSYIDIGTFHPFKFNNTAYFYKQGCRGINIEPNPENFNLIARERKHDVNLNIGISTLKGQLDYYHLTSSTLNTFSKEEAESMVEKHANQHIVKIEKIPVDTITSILDKHFNNSFPDILSLDTEGHDLEILKSIEFQKAAPKIICVETYEYDTTGDGEKNRDIINLLLQVGYMLYADTFINSIFVKKDAWVNAMKPKQ